MPGTGTGCYGLELLQTWIHEHNDRRHVSMPSRAWVVTAVREKKKMTTQVSMPSRAWVVTVSAALKAYILSVSMPSRAWVVTESRPLLQRFLAVSMPSRAWVVTRNRVCRINFCDWFQCPHGLIPHFYCFGSRRIRRRGRMCQCPLGLIPHFYENEKFPVAIWGAVSMPSRAYTSFLPLHMQEWHRISNLVSMPSRAYTSFLQEIRISL